MADVKGYPKRSTVVEHPDGTDVTVTDPLPVGTDHELHDLMRDILTELRILNIHMQFITNETIGKDDAN